ncbi:hypothetical protein [Salisediminibacterium beveridgei]|uniref:Uncharacterized protein n=1 Tax=Salisediminibacterium beveridgei TaxID=632773 RepID=A0A1D7QSD9_9BACI|nr:hypothetical protein [Salisediminibacterium beveridgei]AOM81907.1 hypothetical protein BBEV_0514 [Salisediminibacterium beveridgei]
MNFRIDLLKEYIEMDKRIEELHKIINHHPEHKRSIKIEESNANGKGKIQYFKTEVIIELDVKLNEESILILGHELMHYLLILNGALLPVKINENNGGFEEGLNHFLMKGLTHHLLLKQELNNIGFEELQTEYSLCNSIQPMPPDFYFGYEMWLLELFDRSTFAENYDFASLKNQFSNEGLSEVYEILKSSSNVTIEGVNNISGKLIRIFNCENELKLKNIDYYTGI